MAQWLKTPDLHDSQLLELPLDAIPEWGVFLLLHHYSLILTWEAIYHTRPTGGSTRYALKMGTNGLLSNLVLRTYTFLTPRTIL